MLSLHGKLFGLTLMLPLICGCRGCQQNSNPADEGANQQSESSESVAAESATSDVGESAEDSSAGEGGGESASGTGSAGQQDAPIEGESSNEPPGGDAAQPFDGQGSSEQFAESGGAGGGVDQQASAEPSTGSAGGAAGTSGGTNSGNGPGRPGGASSEERLSPPSLAGPKFSSPAKALQFAKSMQATAGESFKDGEIAEAYQEALQGWQALQLHLGNEACRERSRALLADLERYGEGLGSPGRPIVGKPLKIK